MKGKELNDKIEETIYDWFEKRLDRYEKDGHEVYFDVDHAYVEFYHSAIRYYILERLLDGMSVEDVMSDWKKNKAENDFGDSIELMGDTLEALL